MSNKFPSGKHDKDFQTMRAFTDDELQRACNMNQYTKNLCNDEQFWRQRIFDRYGADLEGYLLPNESYKRTYIRLNSYKYLTNFLLKIIERNYVPILRKHLLDKDLGFLNNQPEVLVEHAVKYGNIEVLRLLRAHNLLVFGDSGSKKRIAKNLAKLVLQQDRACEIWEEISSVYFGEALGMSEDKIANSFANNILSSAYGEKNYNLINCVLATVYDYQGFKNMDFLNKLQWDDENASDSLEIFKSLKKNIGDDAFLLLPRQYYSGTNLIPIASAPVLLDFIKILQKDELFFLKEILTRSPLKTALSFLELIDAPSGSLEHLLKRGDLRDADVYYFIDHIEYTYTRTELQLLKIVYLKHLLRRMNLKVTGIKSDLIDRIYYNSQ